MSLNKRDWDSPEELDSWPLEYLQDVCSWYGKYVAAGNRKFTRRDHKELQDALLRRK